MSALNFLSPFVASIERANSFKGENSRLNIFFSQEESMSASESTAHIKQIAFAFFKKNHFPDMISERASGIHSVIRSTVEAYAVNFFSAISPESPCKYAPRMPASKEEIP